MAIDNLYAPPSTRVGDVEVGALGTFQPVKLWPPSGRIGRVRMLAYGMALYLILIAATIVIGVVLAVTAKNSATFSKVVLGIVYLAYLIAGVSVMVQRSHDMDLSGWSVLLLLIPLVFFYWLFKRGTPGPNRFGSPPPPNSTGVKVLAWCIVVVPFLLGLLAAIAVPAYNDYTVRAKARSIQQP